MLKKIAYYLLFLPISMILIGELIFAIFPIGQEEPKKEKKPPYDTAVIDEKLGWKPKENYQFTGQMQSLDGQSYSVNLNSKTGGFRYFPAKILEQKRLFVLGDSYTQAVEVSDDKTYYALLQDSLDLNIYAFGMSGYGTLQEYLILEQYLDEIDPAVVLLQVCSNDFLDNDLELEKNANYQVGLKRPYWGEDDQIYYSYPISKTEYWLKKTRFLYFCYDRFRSIKNKQNPPISSEAMIAEKGVEAAPFQKSIQTSKKLLGKIKDRLGPNRKLLVFSADPFEPQQQQWREICWDLGLDLIRFPLGAIDTAKMEQEVYAADGYHWNEKGHEVIGLQLLKELKSSGL